jgi:hypothetical protein
MDNQLQENGTASDRFFGLPASWRIWSNLGRRFWAGVLLGIGLGLLIGAVLVEQELMTLHRKAWVAATGIVLAGVGQALAWGTVGDRKQSSARNHSPPEKILPLCHHSTEMAGQGHEHSGDED